MDNLANVFTPPALAMGAMEVIKWVVKKYKPSFVFSDLLYTVLLAALNVLAVPILVWLSFPGYALPASVGEFLRTLLVAVIGSVLSKFLYNNTLKVSKEEKLPLDKS